MNPKESYQVTDELWAKIQPLLPEHVNTHRFGGGRPRADNRICLDGILFVLRTGCQWGALDQTRLCKKSSAHRWFQEWTRAGVFLLIWALGLDEYEELKGLDWSWQSMDGAMTKAPLGGEKNGAQSHRSSQARRQAEHADRRRGNPGRPGRGRGQRQRL